MKLVILTAAAILCVACVGGDGDSGGRSATPMLVPLNISTTDLYNNVIPYINLPLVGSYTRYKLRFTNPNSEAVTTPSNWLSFYDSSWLVQQTSNESADGYSYYAYDNPGVYSTTTYFNRTNNSDDCFNTSHIPAGSSCSFYTYAFNPGSSLAVRPKVFSYPLSYNIQIYPSSIYYTSSLDVTQCPDNNDCSNESKPGYANQFISYLFNPINPGTTNLPANTFDIYSGGPVPVITYDGNWFFTCKLVNVVGTFNKDVVCEKYKMTYKDNVLTKAVLPDKTIKVFADLNYGNTLKKIYPSLDGNSIWLAVSNESNGLLIYSESPTQLFSVCGNNRPCVPNISKNVSGMTGMDGSFWGITESGADVYIPSQGTFVQTNIPATLGGVDANGVAVTRDGFCYRPTADPAVYTRQSIANYNVPPPGVISSFMHKQVYLSVAVDGLIIDGGKIVDWIYAYYMVHTENGLCEVQQDDYSMVAPPAMERYAITLPHASNRSDYYVVMPESYIYFGK